MTPETIQIGPGSAISIGAELLDAEEEYQRSMRQLADRVGFPCHCGGWATPSNYPFTWVWKCSNCGWSHHTPQPHRLQKFCQ